MRIAGKKLTQIVPEPARPYVRALGQELERVQERLRRARLAAQMSMSSVVEHVRGPRELGLAPNELVVVAMIRNEATHLPTFLRHYAELGARHVVLLDNGSTDETMDIAASADDVTLYKTALPYKTHELTLKHWLVSHAGVGWGLLADADELFDYPWRTRLPLARFLDYMNEHGYDAVCGQNLEMVPDAPLMSYQGVVTEDLRGTHRYYDTTDYRRIDEYWRHRNELGSPDLWSHTGGVWETFFGYTGSKLSKQPLVRPSSGLDYFPYDVHFVVRGRIADVSGVFRHYKYTGRFARHVAEELERKAYFNDAEIYDHYARVLRENPNLSFVRDTSREWTGAEALVPSGFLVASERYRALVGEADGADAGARMGASTS